jgi:hypothetical protein
MTCFHTIENKSLAEIMASDYRSEFHKYSFYHELVNENINPVVLYNLVATSEFTCLPPDIVTRCAGHSTIRCL